LRLRADEPSASMRRVVIAADVADAAVRPVPDVERPAVLVTEPIDFSVVASAHVDDVTAADVVANAAAVVRKADAGDDDAAFVVDEAQAQELQWYATQELDSLMGDS
jgi:hypothetical protein